MNTPLFNLLKKYDVPVPRYTSYPTVLAWNSSVGANQYAESLQHLGQKDLISLYFHLPFCETLCHFCGCMQVITKDHDRSREYTDALLTELDRVSRLILQSNRSVCQIHFGGGTPNFFRPSEVSSLINKIKTLFHLLPSAEIAIEMHPKTSTEEFCRNLKTLEFNRISLGVQDFDPVVQKLINRHQTFEMTESMMNLLRKLGFNHFNFDLIYGLPGQTMEGWSRTLRQVIQLKPNRLAVYSYAHVPWVRPVQRSFKDGDLPSPEMKIKLFEKAYQVFTQKEYRHIGIDHFALQGDELTNALKMGTIHRNFMGYSTRAEAHQIGFGVSAISYVGGHYFQNEKELKNYYHKLNLGSLAVARGFLLERDDLVRRDLIARIMCQGEVDWNLFEKKWNVNPSRYFEGELKRLAPFVVDGLVKLTKEKITVVGNGFLFLRNIASVFDAYLVDIQQRAKTPAFSKGI